MGRPRKKIRANDYIMVGAWSLRLGKVDFIGTPNTDGSRYIFGDLFNGKRFIEPTKNCQLVLKPALHIQYNWLQKMAQKIVRSNIWPDLSIEILKEAQTAPNCFGFGEGKEYDIVTMPEEDLPLHINSYEDPFLNKLIELRLQCH